MKAHRRVLAALLAGPGLLASPLALAAPRPRPVAVPPRAPQGTPEQQAQQLLVEGAAALERRELSAAAQHLGQAYKLVPSAEGLYLLCRLAAAEGDTLRAHDLCRRYLADPSHPPSAAPPHQAEVDALLGAQAAPLPPSGEVVVFGALGALVQVDDRLVGTLPLARPLLLAAGQHRITLLDGDRRQEWPVKVLPERTIEVRFESESNAVLVTQLPGVLVATRLGALPEALARRLRLAIEGAVQAEHLALLRETTALERSPELADCLERLECKLDLASRSGAEYVLSVAVTTVRSEPGGTTAQLALEVLDSRVRASALAVDAVCRGCTPDQLVRAVTEPLGTLLTRGTGRPFGKLTIRSSPRAAEVYIDDTRVGTTRYERPAWSGAYQVELRHPGYLNQRFSVSVEPGSRTELSLTLLPRLAVQRVQSPPRPLWRFLVSGGLAALGLGLLGYGLSGVVLSGSCSDQSPLGVCRARFATRQDGTVLLLVGSALAASGGLLMALPERSRRITIEPRGFDEPAPQTAPPAGPTGR